MPDSFTQSGKQILRNGKHFGDGVSEDAARTILAGMTSRASIADYFDREAGKRQGGLRLALRVMAANVRAKMDVAGPE